MADILVVIALAGGMFSFSVMVEVLEKLGGSDSPTWSVLKLMGPQLWSPTNGDPVRVTIALAILVFSVLYFASCCILDKAATTKNAYLVVPWVLCEGSTIVYQICAAFNVKDRFTKMDESLLAVDTLMGFAAMGYVILTAISWLQRGSSTRSHRVGGDVEARVLHTYVAPEGKPLLKVRQQETSFCVSKTAPKPWKPLGASLLEKLAVVEIAGGKRVRFQTPECSPTEERKFAQRIAGTSLPSVDASRNEDCAVLSCIGGDWLVKYVKPSDTVPRNVFGCRGQVGNGPAHSTAANGKGTNGQCSAVECDYWPCNESTLPSKSKIGTTQDLKLQSSTRSCPTERVNCDGGSCCRSQEVRAKENVYDMPEHTEETIYASIREITESEELVNGFSCPKIQKFTPNGSLKLPDVCQCITEYMEGAGDRDSFCTTDSFTSSRNRHSLGEINDLEASTGSRGATIREIETISGRSSPVKIRPPGSYREGKIWMWSAPESTKRMILSGGRGLGYVYSGSDMELVVFGPKGCVYEASSAGIGTPMRDGVGQVFHRKLTPGTELVNWNSWEGSLTDIGPNQFMQWTPALSCPSLTSQSASSLSQTTSEFLEECMKRQASLGEYSLALSTGASADRLCNTSNKMECISSHHERQRDCLEQKYGKIIASDPGVDTSDEDLVDHGRKIDKRFLQNGLKRSEYWFVKGVDSGIFTHALNRSSSDIVTSADNNEPPFYENRTVDQ